MVPDQIVKPLFCACSTSKEGTLICGVCTCAPLAVVQGLLFWSVPHDTLHISNRILCVAAGAMGAGMLFAGRFVCSQLVEIKMSHFPSPKYRPWVCIWALLQGGTNSVDMGSFGIELIHALLFTHYTVMLVHTHTHTHTHTHRNACSQ